LPGPFRFCNVINEAMMRAAFDWFELSVGNETLALGLLTALPAATFMLRAWNNRLFIYPLWNYVDVHL